MRASFLPVLLLLVFAPAARAAKPVTVAELEQILAADHGQSDRRVAGQLSGLVLTERASYARLTQWQSEVRGQHAQAALLLLADESAFLDLPAADVSPAPPPSMTAQVKMVDLAIEYVKKTVHDLPNFMATRTSLHFEDSLHQAVEQSRSAGMGSAIRSMGTAGVPMESLNYQPLHLTGRSNTAVTYRDGDEVQSASSGKKAFLGLTTRGEFGPILSVVLSDATHSSITWGYWQRTAARGNAAGNAAAGNLAVFRYTVPAENSHYLVGFQTGQEPVETHPAYHGEIAVDPATGSILRVSMLSEMAPPYQLVGTGILVEYGPVAFGDRASICPRRGVALSKMPVLPDAQAVPTDTTPVQTRLNDVAFTNYHLFRAEARILSGEEAKRLGASPQ